MIEGTKNFGLGVFNLCLRTKGIPMILGLNVFKKKFSCKGGGGEGRKCFHFLPHSAKKHRRGTFLCPEILLPPKTYGISVGGITILVEKNGATVLKKSALKYSKQFYMSRKTFRIFFANTK